jgi:hypothetical protein
MFVFNELNDLVVITYEPSTDDVFRSFARGFGKIPSVYRCDFLLDLRGLAGPLDILSSEDIGKQWALLARGRDVGRRTAIVSTDAAIQGQLEIFRAIYPFRKIAMFDDYDTAMNWVIGISDMDKDDIQFI